MRCDNLTFVIKSIYGYSANLGVEECCVAFPDMWCCEDPSVLCINLMVS